MDHARDLQRWEDAQDALVALAQATGAWPDPRVRKAIALAVRRQDEDRVNFMLQRLQKAALRDDSRLHPFLPDPDERHVGGGDVKLGSLVTGGQASLNKHDFLLNAFISGPPGSGKSVLVTQLVQQLLNQRVAVHIFDTQGEYPDVLAPQYPVTELECIDFRDCRLNPFLGPTDMAPKDWVLGPMCDYLREALWWRDRTIELFRTLCLTLFEQGNDAITPPMFAGAFDRLPEYKKKQNEAGSLQRFTTMIRTLETFECRRGERVEDLSQRSRVYDLWNASKDVRLFFVSHMMTLHKASRRFKRDRDLELVFVFDELSQFITKEAVAAKADLGESFFLELLRTGRKMGIGCILADQTYSLIHQVVRTNCQTKVAFETSDGRSRQEISRDFGLSREQSEFLCELSFDKPGRRAAAHLHKYPRAFLVEIDHFTKPTPLNPTETEKRRRQIIDNMDWEPIPEKPKKAPPRPDVLPEKILRVLKTIAFDHFATQQEHAGKMGIAESTFSKYAAQLRQAGLVTDEAIHKGIRGAKVKILVPTKEGYTYLKKSKIDYKPIPGNGTITHRYWQHQILKKAKKEGDIGGVEYSLNEKRVDVGITNPSTKTAYEVVNEGPLEKEITNLRKDLEEGWDRVIFCVENEETRQALARLIDAELGDADDRAEIRLLKEYA